ncbi:hypothetical protein F2Q69_00042583 [Brassica cretica]|uniref:Uncharacterized protein n=1 Tax=Brassica cretica TaxID=69181 RepID=A0A8S9ND80_BRACR|nr:hypothetical protein F2Q69_00042583 [Brassica cretica]
MFETRALGLGQELGLLSVKVYAVTSRLSFFLLRFLPDSHRFKVRGMFSAYMTCMALIPPIDERIQGFWDSIPVSPDTEEVSTGFPDDGEEVDRPADAFGASLSGDFDFGL